MYDDDRDALAAEYVLGTLSADEREQAEALLLIDPGFAEVVRSWEHRLGELNVMVEAVEPPPEIWERVKTDIDGAERRIAAEAEENKAPETEASLLPTIEEPAPQTVPEPTIEVTPEVSPEVIPEVTPETAAEPSPQPAAEDLLAAPAEHLDATPPEDADDSAAVAALASSLLSSQPGTDAPMPAPAPPGAAEAPKIERGADVVYLARRVRRWRSLTVAMSAVAALLAVYVAVSQLAPGLLPAARLPQTAALEPPPPASRLVAVLQQEPTAPAFLLTVDPHSRTMTVRRLTSSVDPGRSYELWLIAGKDSKPQSLGLVGASEFTTRPLPAGFEPAQMRAASYAVSLEPAGGSPSGVPTGPVLFTGRMVESVPTAAAAPKS